MDIKKIIKRVEVVKKELAIIRKEVDVECKRLTNAQTKGAKAREALEIKIQNLPLGLGPTDPKVEKLQKQISAIRIYDNTYLGDAGDWPEDSVLGALSTAQQSLDELVSGKKKLVGHLVLFEKNRLDDENLHDE